VLVIGLVAEWAVRETRIGKVADKVLKNRMACQSTLDGWRGVPLGGVRRNDALRLVEIGRPAGVTEGPDGAIFVSDDYAGVVYRITSGSP